MTGSKLPDKPELKATQVQIRMAACDPKAAFHCMVCSMLVRCIPHLRDRCTKASYMYCETAVEDACGTQAAIRKIISTGLGTRVALPDNEPGSDVESDRTSSLIYCNN